ncbi:MAG TPA: AsmA-like C-terminal region-containing protein [Verrucomicrobiae bacterium]|nr:AsmA-like C-terminal region-containing protein [Verrucomicrobiae bacterium]
MQSGFWRKCRLCLRWFRRAFLLGVVVIICAIFWFDRVGLPDFLKQRLVESLRTRGVELEFSRVRFSLTRGVVAENVRVGHSAGAGPGSPTLSVDESALDVDIPAALHGRLQIDGLTVRGGRLVLPLSSSNALTIDHIQTDLRFSAEDFWSLDNFHAEFAGAQLALSGDLAHAPEIRRWGIFRGADTTNAAAARARLKRISDALDRIHFTGTPRLNLYFNGDARDVHSFNVRLAVTAPAVESPWADAHGFQFNARLTAPAGRSTNVTALTGFWTNLQPFRITWTAQAADLRTGHFSADAVECDGLWRAPDLALTRLTARQAAWAPGWTVRGLNATADLTAPGEILTNIDVSWAGWTNLQPYRLAWTARLETLESDKLNADSVVLAGSWNAPDLVVNNLSAQVGGGPIEARTRLNVATREFVFTNVSRFDLHAIAALLTDKTRERLAEFTWTQPPSLHADGSIILPAWTNRHPDWRGEVQPTIRLRGEVAFTNGTVLGARIDRADARFTYSNLVWRLPAFAVVQSRTRLEITGTEDDATKNYRWHLRGAFDPAAIRPFLTTSNAMHGYEAFRFTEPVHLDAVVWGRLYDYESIGGSGFVALTNFTVHDQSVDHVTGDFSYTNRVFVFFSPHLWRGTQTMTADRIVLDLRRFLISFTNGYSTADPRAVAHAIGPKTAHIMEPYHFLEPPTVLVEGHVPLRDVKIGQDIDEADLRFDIVRGVPFECLKLRASRVTGTIHWMGQVLILTNIVAELYGGTGNGFANFDFRVPHEGAEYEFTTAVTNINIHALAADVSSHTNHIEGSLSGQVVVTHADSRNWRAMDGSGHARLSDGLIWDIPLFGLLSPVLNTVSPGLGDSRATDAEASFVITNGVIYSNPLRINTGMTRLQYSGTVDMRGNVDAHVTAQLLHNIWGVGPLISTLFTPVTKIFEYKVTGTLENPKKEPVYVPKLLFLPLHPIRTLEELIPGNPDFFNATNTPATGG